VGPTMNDCGGCPLTPSFGLSGEVPRDGFLVVFHIFVRPILRHMGAGPCFSYEQKAGAPSFSRYLREGGLLEVVRSSVNTDAWPAAGAIIAL
jgi:hypothetical protein